MNPGMSTKSEQAPPASTPATTEALRPEATAARLAELEETIDRGLRTSSKSDARSWRSMSVASIGSPDTRPSPTMQRTAGECRAATPTERSTRHASSASYKPRASNRCQATKPKHANSHVSWPNPTSFAPPGSKSHASVRARFQPEQCAKPLSSEFARRPHQLRLRLGGTSAPPPKPVPTAVTSGTPTTLLKPPDQSRPTTRRTSTTRPARPLQPKAPASTPQQDGPLEPATPNRSHARPASRN